VRQRLGGRYYEWDNLENPDVHRGYGVCGVDDAGHQTLRSNQHDVASELSRAAAIQKHDVGFHVPWNRWD